MKIIYDLENAYDETLSDEERTKRLKEWIEGAKALLKRSEEMDKDLYGENYKVILKDKYNRKGV